MSCVVVAICRTPATRQLRLHHDTQHRKDHNAGPWPGPYSHAPAATPLEISQPSTLCPPSCSPTPCRDQARPATCPLQRCSYRRNRRCAICRAPPRAAATRSGQPHARRDPTRARKEHRGNTGGLLGSAGTNSDVDARSEHLPEQRLGGGQIHPDLMRRSYIWARDAGPASSASATPTRTHRAGPRHAALAPSTTTPWLPPAQTVARHITARGRDLGEGGGRGG